MSDKDDHVVSDDFVRWVRRTENNERERRERLAKDELPPEEQIKLAYQLLGRAAPLSLSAPGGR